MSRRRVSVEPRYLPYRRPLSISRGLVTGAAVITVSIEEEGIRGSGEACPSERYGETTDGVLAAIARIRPSLEAGLDRAELQQTLARGAARNAVDCALWDLEAKRSGKRAWELAGLPEPGFVLCAQTISLDSPEVMANQAKQANAPLLKLKLGGDGDIERVAAVREAVPTARLIVDANEAWTLEHLELFPPLLARLGVELIEQPLPAGRDSALDGHPGPIPMAADESFHDASMIDEVLGRYQAINIKLDKTGGLTEALRAKRAAEEAGLSVMVGCMGGTSRAMAPALIVAWNAAVTDLDGPLLLVEDCGSPLQYTRGVIGPYGVDLWG